MSSSAGILPAWHTQHPQSCYAGVRQDHNFTAYAVAFLTYTGHGRLSLHTDEQCAFIPSNKSIHLPPQASQAFLSRAPQTAKLPRSISHHGCRGDFISRDQKCQHANTSKTAQQHQGDHTQQHSTALSNQPELALEAETLRLPSARLTLLHLLSSPRLTF